MMDFSEQNIRDIQRFMVRMDFLFCKIDILLNELKSNCPREITAIAALEIVLQSKQEWLEYLAELDIEQRQLAYVFLSSLINIIVFVYMQVFCLT